MLIAMDTVNRKHSRPTTAVQYYAEATRYGRGAMITVYPPKNNRTVNKTMESLYSVHCTGYSEHARARIRTRAHAYITDKP